jgi:Xaa-Pro aminopeptidase
MTHHERIASMRSSVRSAGLDAWFLYDFRGSNHIAWSMLEMPADAHCTRRWMVVIPAYGEPYKIVHRMEQIPLQHLDMASRVYATRLEWESAVAAACSGMKHVAMEYSPFGQLPVVSTVDAGMMEHIRSHGVDVVSSADMAQHFTSVLTSQQITDNRQTAASLRAAVMSAFRLVRSRLLSQEAVSEYEVQQHLLRTFEQDGLITDHPPIVAIGPNASRPHYAPSAEVSSPISRGDILLIDAWVRRPEAGSVYADITWVGVCDETVPNVAQERFAVLTHARDAAVSLVRERFAAGEPVCGYEVDRACRTVIEQAGYGSLFIHRTGHNITDQVHGPGANMDDFETHDTRVILPGMSFSVEPGLYELDVLGLRTELDVVVTTKGEVTIPSEPIQRSILPLLAAEDPCV